MKHVWLAMIAVGIFMLAIAHSQVTVREHTWPSSPADWIVIDLGDGLKHFYRESSITSMIDTPNDRAEITVGGKSYYVPLTADEMMKKFQTPQEP